MYRTLTNIAKRFFSDAQIYKYGFNWSPMYRRSTGKVIEVSEDLLYIKVKIPLNWKNRNFVGSIFGGSMLSATDPIYMIQLLKILGDDYVVWDKSATIKYKNEDAILSMQNDPEAYNRTIIWPDKVKINKNYVAHWRFYLDLIDH